MNSPAIITAASLAIVSVALLIFFWTAQPYDFSFSLGATPGMPQPGNQTRESSLKNKLNASSSTTAKSDKKECPADVETILARARDSIRKAALRNDSKCTPREYCIYRARFEFYRSYREMEKRMKIYVYREGEPPLVHDAPITGVYSTEGLFINQLENYKTRNGESFLTPHPEEACLYFLPFSVTRMVKLSFEGTRHSPSNRDVRALVRDYMDVISRKHPFFNRSKGSDHFMLSCHDWAPFASEANDFLYTKSVRVLCNANVSEGFVPAKDATLPEMKLRREEQMPLLHGRPANDRDVLAFFAGQDHGPVRPILFQHWLNSGDPDMQIHKVLRKNYSDYMARARFCLCPSGYEVASPRLVEALYSGCVPVVISWGYVLPFSDVLNWKAFSLSVSPDDIPRLKEILQSIPKEKYFQMQSAVLRVRKHFRANEPPKRMDMFHMILHSVWLRRLNTRVVLPSSSNSSCPSPMHV